MAQISPGWNAPEVFSAAAVTKANIEAVTAFRTAIENTKVKWQEGKGTGGLCYPVYGEAILGLLQALYANNFVQPFDYNVWYKKSGERYVLETALLKSADLEICIKLLTTHARADRLCDGWFGDMVERGHIGKILDRLVEISDTL